MNANGLFFGSVQILSNIQSHMVYFQLSQIYSLAAKRLGVLGRSERSDRERFARNLKLRACCNRQGGTPLRIPVDCKTHFSWPEAFEVS
jgi:hypothetical protein